MADISISDAIERFGALRGSGPYAEGAMMEAALLIEELCGFVLTEAELHENNLGDIEALRSFAGEISRR